MVIGIVRSRINTHTLLECTLTTCVRHKHLQRKQHELS